MRITIGYRDQIIYLSDTGFQPSEDIWESIRSVLSTLLVRTNGRLQLTGEQGIRFYIEETNDP